MQEIKAPVKRKKGHNSHSIRISQTWRGLCSLSTTLLKWGKWSLERELSYCRSDSYKSSGPFSVHGFTSLLYSYIENKSHVYLANLLPKYWKNMIKILKIKCNQDSRLNLLFIEQIQFCKNFLRNINEPWGKNNTMKLPALANRLLLDGREDGLGTLPGSHQHCSWTGFGSGSHPHLGR